MSWKFELDVDMTSSLSDLNPKKCFYSPLSTITYLQSLLQQLIHARHPGGNAEVDGPVADFDDQAAADIGVDLQHKH